MHASTFLRLLSLVSVVEGTGSAQHRNASSLQPGSSASIANFKSKIKNVIVLVMENRSLDNLLGGQTIPGLSNPTNDGPFCNPLNVTAPDGRVACSNSSDYNEVIDDPNHSVSGNNLEFYGTYLPDNNAISTGQLQPQMQGFVTEQIASYGTSPKNDSLLSQQVMNYYTEEQVAPLTALVQNFVTFNHWHSAIPGPTNPNRVALHSGTTAGAGTNNFPYGFMQQRSIFQQLSETNHTWKNYVTDTSEEDALWFNWTYTSGNNNTNVVSIDNFYTDALLGQLPEFTVLGPSCCGVGTNSMHPQGLISDGMTLIKDIYQALRTSPQWEQSLLLITFDETGGFHDHIPPPLVTPPDNLTYTELTPTGQNYTFTFDRLGGRIPTLLVSPWVSHGYVEQQGTNSAGQTVSYNAASMLRTLGYLWDFEPFNPRVESAPSFDALIGTEMNANTPWFLPAVDDF